MPWDDGSYHGPTSGEKHTNDRGPTFRARLARALAWLVVLLAISAPWLNVPVDNADSAGMQAHLHALFEARDLLYDDEYAALHMSPLFAFVTERGVVSNHWPIGASFLQAPGWLLGRLAGLSLVGEGVSRRAAAWTVPLLGLRCWAILVLVWIASVTHRWLRARVGAPMATWAVAGFVVGTPLLYYAIESPLRPHLWGACVVALLAMRWFEAIEHARGSSRTSLELAMWAGLATAIRPQLAMLALLVAHERWVASAGLEPRARLWLLVRHGSASALVFAIWPLLILRMQLWMYGGLGDYAGEVSHHLRAFLLSTHHGALVWCPVLVLGLLGLAIGLASRRRGAGVLLLILAAQIWLDAGTREIEPYAVLGTRTWTGGTAFGPRKLLDVVPLMLPGVVWLSAWLGEQPERERTRWLRRLGGVAGLSLAITLSLLLGALVDPAVCSTVLDGERLIIALTLGLDPANWAQAFEQRALPDAVTARVILIVGVPLASLVTLSRMCGETERAESAKPSNGWPWIAVLIYGLCAHAWTVALERRSAALLDADPQRMARAAADMHPWHEATVAQIPQQHALLRARLGPEAAR